MRFAITVDAASPRALAEFWKVAVDYVDSAPPTGWATWEAWLRDHGVPEDEWDDGATIADPTGAGPSISFLRVPEAKTVKNRVHLDVLASGGRHLSPDVRTERIRAAAARLEALGATFLEEHRIGDVLDHVVLADPEGNEFCIV
jgi:hypothetical protein